MERIPSATVSLNFCGTLARTLRATWTWQRCTLAPGNSSAKTFSKPGSPSMIARLTFAHSRPLLFKSLKNSLQLDADSLSPACNPRTRRWPDSVTPIATRTGVFSMESPTRMSKLTPSIKRYFICSWDKSRFLHLSTESTSSLLAWLTSVWEIFRPMRRLDITAKVRVLTPPRNIRQRSRRISSSYCLLRGSTWVSYSPFLSRGTLTETSPMPLTVKFLP